MAVHDDASIASRGQIQAHVAIAFLTLAWFFISLRVFTRTCVIKNFGWDDSTMIFAAVMFTVYCATMIYLNANGAGTHITSVPDLVNLTKASSKLTIWSQNTNFLQVDYYRRGHLSHNGHDTQDLAGHLLRTHRDPAMAALDHLCHCVRQHRLFSIRLLLRFFPMRCES
jgi:hypothetical protein